MSSLASPRSGAPAPLLVRLLSVPVVVLVLLGGGWIAAGSLSNDFKTSTALTALWVGLVGVACLVLFLRRREMWPALAAFAVTSAAAGIYLGSQTFIDKEVDEDVVTAPVPARPDPGRATAPDRPAPPANVLLSRGRFDSLEHPTEGVARVIRVRGGRRYLTLTDFRTDRGPDLRVYLTTADSSQDSRGEESIDLGGLKGNIGDQQYKIPADADLGRLTKAVIWCRAFSVGFGSAPLDKA